MALILQIFSAASQRSTVSNFDCCTPNPVAMKQMDLWKLILFELFPEQKEPLLKKKKGLLKVIVSYGIVINYFKVLNYVIEARLQLQKRN
jgi:hypothetical protein